MVAGLRQRLSQLEAELARVSVADAEPLLRAFVDGMQPAHRATLCGLLGTRTGLEDLSDKDLDRILADDKGGEA